MDPMAKIISQSRYKIMYIMGKIFPRAYNQPPRPIYETLVFTLCPKTGLGVGYMSLGDDFTHDIHNMLICLH